MAEEKIQEKEVEKKKEVAGAKLVEIPTQTTVAVQLENGEVVTTEELLVRVYNEVRKIGKII